MEKYTESCDKECISWAIVCVQLNNEIAFCVEITKYPPAVIHNQNPSANGCKWSSLRLKRTGSPCDECAK